MIFLLFAAAVVVVELILRHESKRPLRDERVKTAAAMPDHGETSLEGLLALNRALDRYGQGKRPVAAAAPVAKDSISCRESSD